jgi:UDP-glucose 4-epimerase
MHALRYLVTGAAGFLGTRLCDRLLREGADVHATSRSHRVSEHSRLRWWRTDLLEYAPVQELVDEIRPDIVFHLAGQVTAAPDLQLALPLFHSQLGGTLNILVAATKSGCRRIVTVGSLTEPDDNGIAPIPSSPYAAAKYAATAYARMFHSLYETPIVVLRLFITYGPGQHETKVVPYVVNSLLQGRAPSLSSGTWQADWVYVDDAINAFLTAATCPGIDGSTIDIGGGKLTSIRDVVAKIVRITNSQIEPQFGALPERPNEQIRVANTADAQKLLGWTATTGLDEGLAATVRWHEAQMCLPLPLGEGRGEGAL